MRWQCYKEAKNSLHAASSINSRPTIGIVVPALNAGGGVPAVAEFLCAQLERSGQYCLRLFSLPTSSRDECSVRLLAPATWRAGPRTRHGTWGERPYTHVGAIGAELEFQRYRPRARLSQLLAQCDLIQVVAGSPAIALAAVQCGRPVVLQVATRLVVERAGALAAGPAAQRAWRLAMTTICNRLDDAALASVDAVMVENQWMLEYAAARAPRGHAAVQLAPPGIDAVRFRPSPQRAAQVRHDPYILFVGRLADPRKNCALLCEAYVTLCAQWPAAPRLTIAGQGELPEAARQMLARLADPGRINVVSSPGPGELLRLFQGAACLAVPSTEEGFGLVVVEAMACGVPVIATRCGGPEEIITSGIDGVLTPLDDAREFAAALRVVCADPARNADMGRRARAMVESRYAAEAAIAPFLDTYARLLQ